MKEEFKKYLTKVFQQGSTFGRLLDAGEFTASKRNMLFFTPFHNDGPVPAREPAPWDEGWTHYPGGEGKLPPWMKVRYCTSEGIPIYSTMMYHPQKHAAHQ